MIKKYFFAATLLASCLCIQVKCVNPQHAIFKQIRTKKIELFTQQYLEFQNMLPAYVEQAQAFEAAQNKIGEICKQLLDQNIIAEQDFEAVNMFLVQEIGGQEKPDAIEVTKKAGAKFPALATEEAQNIVTKICKQYVTVIPVFMEFATVSQAVEEHSEKLETTKRELVATGMTREEVETLEREIVQAITQVLEAGIEQSPKESANSEATEKVDTKN